MSDSSAKILDALDMFQEGIYIINEDFTIEYMNGYMRELFGDGVGQKCHEVINHSPTPCHWCKCREIFENNESHQSEIYIAPVGRHFSLTELPVTNHDGTRSKLTICRDISRSKEQEARFISSRESYQRLFTHVGCGVFISSKEGRFLDVNPALLKILGYTNKDEFLALDLATDVYLRPQDRQIYMDIIEKKGRVIDYEVQWRHRSGRILHILLTSNVRYDPQGNILGYEGIIVDQTRRKTQENMIREARDFRDRIISSSPNAIMVLDMNGTIKLWNQGAEETFGYTAAEVVETMAIHEIFSKDLSKEVMAMIRGDSFGGKGRLTSYALTFTKKDGEVVEGNLSAGIVYDDRGNELATVATFVDLRERLEMERELSTARQHLLQSEKLAAMGRLTSQIAHELNNPLFGIMNTLELMKTEISPQNKRRKLLDMSLSETMRLADMLKKMLSFSKPDQEIRSEININDIIDELMLLYDKRFRENSVKVTLDLAENPGMILASRDQLRQVFINMFSNSMYAMPDGGSLEIATRTNGSWLNIEVKDSGFGIAPEHIEQVFDSFFTTKQESVQGVGLGLSVCYGFIKDHDGDIKVESEEGKWTKFTIKLPLHNTP